MTDAQVEPLDAPVETFASFPIHPQIVEALADAGITHPFPIQSMTLPVALGGHDIIGQAKTGTGKTLGFGIPLLNRVVSPSDEAWADFRHPGKPQALAVAPTRELAVQVAGDLERAAAKRGIRVLTVYGGRAYEPQVEALKRGVEVVVGTPGRLIDLAKQGHLDLSHAGIVVLDEADEMLDLGFLPDVEKLLAMTPPNRQTMLFSATMPGAVVALARRYMGQPTHIRAMTEGDDDTSQTVKAIKQFVFRAHAMDKTEMLARILQARGRGLALVFTRTKRTAAKVSDDLADRGFAAAAIHGDLGQGAREQALRAFRSGKVDVLVATDVAARGIDVDNVTHVINFQCPEDEETYSSSEHLYEELDIPREAKGRLPKAQQTRAGLDAEVLEDLGETGKSGGRRGQGGGRSGRAPARNGESRSKDREGSRGERRERQDTAAANTEAAPRRRQRRRTRGGQAAEQS